MSLGLNDHHQKTTVEFIRFARYQRSQRLRGIDSCFKDIKRSRLDENNYTVDEVECLLDELHSEIKDEMENELLNASHTNVLLLRQMFQQAEKWKLKLSADIGELENRDLLQKIREFEDREFSGAKEDVKPILEPMNDSNASDLLKMEISRLERANEKVLRKLSHLERQALQLNDEKLKLMRELDKACGRGAAGAVIKKLGGDTDTQLLERDLERMNVELEESKAYSYRSARDMEHDMSDSKEELLKIKHMLEIAEAELERKVSHTAPYKNLKQMLQSKNVTIKNLRNRLRKYEDDEESD